MPSDRAKHPGFKCPACGEHKVRVQLSSDADVRVLDLIEHPNGGGKWCVVLVPDFFTQTEWEIDTLGCMGCGWAPVVRYYEVEAGTYV